MKHHQIWILRCNVVFLLIVLLLAFFSSTMDTFHLPSVTVALAKTKAIVNRVDGIGVVQLRDGDATMPETTLYEVEMDVTGDFSTILFVGYSTTFDIPAQSMYQVEGNVESIRADNGRMLVTIQFEAEGLQDGEIATLHAEKSLGLQSNVVPNSAIVMTDTPCIYIVQRKRSTLGYDYILKPIYVITVVVGDTHTSIESLSGEALHDVPIVVNSDGFIDAGFRVKLADADEYIGVR